MTRDLRKIWIKGFQPETLGEASRSTISRESSRGTGADWGSCILPDLEK